MMFSPRILTTGIFLAVGALAFIPLETSTQPALMADMTYSGQSVDNVFQAGAWGGGEISAVVDIVPDVFHLEGGPDDDPDPDTHDLPLKKKWWRKRVLAFVELPAGHDVEDIQVSTVEMTLPGVGAVTAERRPKYVGDYDDDGVPDLMVVFKRSKVRRLLRDEEGEVTLEVSGDLTTGEIFSGSDVVTVIRHGHDNDEDEDDSHGDGGDDDGDHDGGHDQDDDEDDENDG